MFTQRNKDKDNNFFFVGNNAVEKTVEQHLPNIGGRGGLSPQNSIKTKIKKILNIQKLRESINNGTILLHKGTNSIGNGNYMGKIYQMFFLLFKFPQKLIDAFNKSNSNHLGVYNINIGKMQENKSIKLSREEMKVNYYEILPI